MLLLHLTSANTVKIFCFNYSVFVDFIIVLRSEVRSRTSNVNINAILRMRSIQPQNRLKYSTVQAE
jgi:hypothetical protein